MNSHLRYWLATLLMPQVGPRKIMRWLTSFSDIESLFNAKAADLKAAGISEKYHHTIHQPDWNAVDAELDWLASANHHIVCVMDDAYPALLKQSSDPPLVLYVRGNISALHYPQLAVVGARNATFAGCTHAEQFAYYLAKSGFAITSGLALGVDGAAHRGALSAKGVTIGVAGTGLLVKYPAKHASLFDEIAESNGAVISEFPLHTPPRSENFPRRNRIIAGLSLGVLVVEAALKSGSLITARHALEQGREVFAIPGSIQHTLSRGCHHLIQQGAKLVEKASDIVDELQALLAIAHHQVNALVQEKQDANISKCKLNNQEVKLRLPHNLRSLLNYIPYDVIPLDMIVSQSGLTASEVSSMLLTLELNGYIETAFGGYQRCVLTG
jgi:DNA processing protein